MVDLPIVVEGGLAGADALKGRAVEALQRGHAFVEQNGDPEIQGRALWLLEAGSPEIPAALIDARQQDDGSFLPRASRRPMAWEEEFQRWQPGDDLLGCVDALAALSQVGQLARSSVERAASYLGEVQREDGSWGGAEDFESRLAGTGLLGGLVARTRYVRPEVLAGASAFLGKHWEPGRVEGGNHASLVGHASFFSNVKHEDSDPALQWCGRELEKGFRSRRLDACGLLGVLLRCDVSMLPGATLAPDEILEALLGEQARDGGWGALEPAGEEARLEPTLDALAGVVRLCRSL